MHPKLPLLALSAVLFTASPVAWSSTSSSSSSSSSSPSSSHSEQADRAKDAQASQAGNEGGSSHAVGGTDKASTRYHGENTNQTVTPSSATTGAAGDASSTSQMGSANSEEPKQLGDPDISSGMSASGAQGTTSGRSGSGSSSDNVTDKPVELGQNGDLVEPDQDAAERDGAPQPLGTTQ